MFLLYLIGTSYIDEWGKIILKIASLACWNVEPFILVAVLIRLFTIIWQIYLFIIIILIFTFAAILFSKHKPSPVKELNTFESDLITQQPSSSWMKTSETSITNHKYSDTLITMSYSVSVWDLVPGAIYSQHGSQKEETTGGSPPTGCTVFLHKCGWMVVLTLNRMRSTPAGT